MTAPTHYVLLIGDGPGAVYAVYTSEAEAEAERDRKRRYSTKPQEIRVEARTGTRPSWRKEQTP